MSRKMASFCPIFFTRFYRCIGVKMRFWSDLENVRERRSKKMITNRKEGHTR